MLENNPQTGQKAPSESLPGIIEIRKARKRAAFSEWGDYEEGSG